MEHSDLNAAGKRGPGGANQANHKRRESSDVTKAENTKGFLLCCWEFYFVTFQCVCVVLSVIALLSVNTPRYDTSAWVMHVHNNINHLPSCSGCKLEFPFRVLLPASTRFNGTSVCTHGVIVPPTGTIKALHCQDAGVSKQQQDGTCGDLTSS